MFGIVCRAVHLTIIILPDEDQGYFMSSIQLPSDATMQRTLKVVDTFEEEIAHRQAVESNIMILGFGFQGQAKIRPWHSPPSRTGDNAKEPRHRKKRPYSVPNGKRAGRRNNESAASGYF